MDNYLFWDFLKLQLKKNLNIITSLLLVEMGADLFFSDDVRIGNLRGKEKKDIKVRINLQEMYLKYKKGL